VALRAPADDRLLLSDASTSRQPQTADVLATMFSAALTGSGSSSRERLVEVTQPFLGSRAGLGLVDDAPHLESDQVGGHQDPAGPPSPSLGRMSSLPRAGPCVDGREVLVAGCLDRDHVVDLGQLASRSLGMSVPVRLGML